MFSPLTPTLTRLDIARRDEDEIYQVLLGASARKQAADLALTEAHLAAERGESPAFPELITTATRAHELKELAERLFDLCVAKRKQLEAAQKRRQKPTLKLKSA